MANRYDRIFKENIEPLQLPLLKKLLGLSPVKLIPIDAKLQVTQEIEMDNVRRVAHDDPALDYGLQIEFHLPDEDLRKRNFLHYGMFHYITGLPLRQVVIYGGMQAPRRITINSLDLMGIGFNYEVIILNSIDKNIFLHSQIPEELVWAILCNYGNDTPDAVVGEILSRLKKILGSSGKIRKYQKQLLVLSRLRKIETIVKSKIEAMTIHYDIQNDGLYLEGIEKGIEKGIVKGIEEGRTQKEIDFTLKLWTLQAFPFDKIATLVGIPETRVMEIVKNRLIEDGKSEEAALAVIKAYAMRPV